MSHYSQALDDHIKRLKGQLAQGTTPQPGRQRGVVDLHARDDDGVRRGAGHWRRDSLDGVAVASAGELDLLTELLQPHAATQVQGLLKVKPGQYQRGDKVSFQFASKQTPLALPVRG
jgi:hypothetical protein